MPLGTSSYHQLQLHLLYIYIHNHSLSTRCSYLQFGYIIYRRVLGYYSDEEDAFDMRKAMPRDVQKRSVIPMTRPVHPRELEFD